MCGRAALIAVAIIAIGSSAADATATDDQELPIATILAQHAALNGKIVRFRGTLVSGGMGNQALCSDDSSPAKCLWFGGSSLFRDFQKREPGATRFVVQGRVEDRCIRQECTDVFAQIEDAAIISKF